MHVISIYLHRQFQSSGFKWMTKRQASALIAAYTNRFLREGGEITICKPAIAAGSEMRINERHLIRRDQRLSLG